MKNENESVVFNTSSFNIEVLENKSIDYLLNFLVFRKINANKWGEHSINKIYRDKDGKIFAGRCNCQKGNNHLILNNKVDWNNNISSEFVLFSKQHSFQNIILSLLIY